MRKAHARGEMLARWWRSARREGGEAARGATCFVVVCHELELEPFDDDEVLGQNPEWTKAKPKSLNHTTVCVCVCHADSEGGSVQNNEL